MTSGDDNQGWQLDLRISFVGQAEPEMPSLTDDITEAVERVLTENGFTTTSSGYGVAPVPASTVKRWLEGDSVED